MAIDVAKKITKRRTKDTDYEALTELHTKERAFLKEADTMAAWMAQAVVSMLSEQMDGIDTDEDILRGSFHRSFRRLLSQLSTRTEKVVFFHEAIPGFTALTVRKGEWVDALVPPSVSQQDNKPSKKPASKKPALEKSVSSASSNLSDQEIEQERQQAIQSIIQAYINRTGNRVIAIDGLDVTLVLFPMADLKQNLREMGFWSA